MSELYQPKQMDEIILSEEVLKYLNGLLCDTVS
jgi:hypothetical protein